MFSLSTLFSLLSSAPAVIGEAEQVASVAMQEYQVLAANPAVQALEALLAANFTHTVTPGSAVVVEPIAPPLPAGVSAGVLGTGPTGR